jgi:hypothetical protein
MPKYTREQIQTWFTHPASLPSGTGQAITQLHASARDLALHIFDTVPEGIEKNLALERLQESVMWASVALTRQSAMQP